MVLTVDFILPILPLTVTHYNVSNNLTRAGQWARDNYLASRQRQRDNIIQPQGPVRDQKKI